MSSLLQNLPQDWQVKTLGECLEYEQPTKYIVKNTQYSDEYEIPVLTAGKSFLLGYTNDTENIFTQTPVIIFDDFTTDSKFVDFHFKVKSSAMKILHATKIANIKFVFYFMQTIQYRSDTHKRYWISEYAKLPIPLPPIETQKAIVEKLENAFAHIDEAVRHLKAVQTNIPRLKSSLLHCAFNGKLTESQNQSNEVQTLKSVVGVEGEFEREERATSPFKPLHPLIKEEIPQGWELKTLGEVAKIKGGKRIPKGSKYADIPTQYPYIRVTDFENMSVNTKNLKYLTDEIQEKIKNYTISKDDVYISIAGSIGKVGIIPDELDKANLTENAAKIIHSMNKKYLAFYLNSNEIQSQISFLTKATTQPKLALNRIENLIIKIPPLATQKQIVQILESKFAHLEKLAQFVNESLENLQRLKSSLLNQAFKGELIC